MQPNITTGRILAITAGVAFTVGGLVILMGAALTDHHQWTLPGSARTAGRAGPQ